MDCEIKFDDDVILAKLSKTIDNSTNILHKKAIALIKGLKEQLGNKSIGLDGIKNYTKNLLDLIDVLFKKISTSKNYKTDQSSFDDDLRNSEAIVFALAVCVKQLPFALLRNEKILERLIDSVEKFMKISSIVPKKFELKKYSMIIAEKLFLSRSENELKNENDVVVKFFTDLYFTLLEDSNSEGEVQKCLIKSLSKILKTPNMNNILKMTFLFSIKNFLIRKIRGLNVGKDYDGNTLTLVSGYDNKVRQLNTSEGETILKFMCSIIQFLPFEIVNDLILELTELIVTSENKHILLNSLLCFEVSFNTKTFALETSEKIIKLLLSKDILINSQENNDDDENLNETKINKIDINTSLTIAFMKSTTGVLLNLSKQNIRLGMRHFTSVFSLLGEFLTSNDSFLRGSVFNCLQSLFNSLMSKRNMAILFTSLLNKDKTDIDIDDLTMEINIDGSKDEGNIISILENISENLLYLSSDRFEDVKLGFNLLLNFIEKISTFSDLMNGNDRPAIENKIAPLVENILTKLSENEKLHKETFKVFIGKIFNFVKASVILKIFSLQMLDFDICSDEYTDNSKVWIVSYIEKFMRNDNQQNLKEFYESFTIVIEDLEKVINKLKKKRVTNTEDMMMDDDMEDDENFMVDNNESQHIRTIKVKRYELILQQVWGLAIKFTNWNPNYDAYVAEILKKFEIINTTYNKEAESISIPNIRDIIFKVLTKMIQNSFKYNDMKSLEVIKKDGKIFFSKCLNAILNKKLSVSEMTESFTLISSFCRIMSEKFLFKIICDMIEKFDKSFNGLFNHDNLSTTAKLNESINFGDMDIVKTQDNLLKSKKSTREKELNLLGLRIEIINYILKNVNITAENNQESNVFALLNSFFEKFFFNEKLNNQQNIKKKLIELFMILMNKLGNPEKILETFSKFINEYRGLETLSAKQKARIFEFIIEIIIKKSQNSVDITECFNQLHILIEIVSLTKDMNRKVRNSSYEMIGKVTDFMSDANLFNEWIKMILAILASNSAFLKSAAINALARIFWQKRHSGDQKLQLLLTEASSVVLLMLKENNKEITKSIFLYIRVLFYLNKNLFTDTNETSNFIKKVIYSLFTDSSEDIKKEFKVKLRNLLKNLIIKFTYEKIKDLVPKEIENLVAYINKHIVKKNKPMTKEEESVYGNIKLDHSVMMDNEENLLDEEEEYIEKEFKKLEKRKDDMEKFIEKLEKFNLEEDDPELIKKKFEAENKKNEKMDKIEALFKKDNIELENFFYVNPYAITNKEKAEMTKLAEKEKEKDQDVFYDRKKNKLIIKDNPVTLKDSQGGKKTPKPENYLNNEKDIMQMDKNKFLKQKRVHNVARDKFDEDDVDMDRRVKRKISNSKEKTDVRGKNKREGHIVKFSGEEYKNKAGKGDKLVQGKYEPFAYIQLNPKTTSHKRRGETLKLFNGVMHPEKKNK